jgi:putative heme transporter
MAERARHLVLDISWRAIVKVLAAAALVWIVLQLAQTIVVLIVGVLLAVTLEPAVAWLERRKVGRTPAASLVCVALLLLVVGALWFTWSSLVAQSEQVAETFTQFAKRWTTYLPDSLRSGPASGGGDTWAAAGAYFLRLAGSASTALTILVLAYVLTFYLLLEGDRVRGWLLAFVPRRSRDRAERTVEEGRQVLLAYVAGNLITSIICTVCTVVVLWALGVPAALLLAVLAGLSDFVPVIGFIVSAIPAVVLALTVSPQTALLVVGFYIAYNAVESYILSPWAYGSRMRLSDVAVVMAFVVGAELAGVIGALIALPVAALYPTVERIWLRDGLPSETVREHRQLEDGHASGYQPADEERKARTGKGKAGSASVTPPASGLPPSA